MTHRRDVQSDSFLAMVMDAPWQVSVAIGVLIFIVLDWVLPAFRFTSPVLIAISDALIAFSWVFSGFFFVIAGLAYLKAATSRARAKKSSSKGSKKQKSAAAAAAAGQQSASATDGSPVRLEPTGITGAVAEASPQPGQQAPAAARDIEPTLVAPAAAEPVPAEPVPAEPVPAEPVPVEPVPVEPVPVEPVPVEPVPVEPVPVEPLPVEPLPVEPLPVEPVPVEPVPVEPIPVEPLPVEPLPLQPTALEPAAIELAAPVQPAPAEPAPSAPEKPTEWTLDLIRDIEWKRFAEVCRKLYEMRGIRCETSAPGTDDGIDLRLYQDDTGQVTSLVQCTVQGGQQVGARPVLGLLGAMTHEKIGKAFFMSGGQFSADAKAVAERNRITLIDGTMLLMMLKRLPEADRRHLLEFATDGDYKTPTCPACGSKMKLIAGTPGYPEFWECQRYPECGQRLGVAREA